MVNKNWEFTASKAKTHVAQIKDLSSFSFSWVMNTLNGTFLCVT